MVFAHIALVGEIQKGAELGENLDKQGPPARHGPPQRSALLPQCLDALGVRGSVDKVGNGLSLGQVDPAVLQRPPCELAGTGGATARQPGERMDQGLHDGPTAMDMEFRTVLTRCAGRTRKPQN